MEIQVEFPKLTMVGDWVLEGTATCRSWRQCCHQLLGILQFFLLHVAHRSGFGSLVFCFLSSSLFTPPSSPTIFQSLFSFSVFFKAQQCFKNQICCRGSKGQLACGRKTLQRFQIYPSLRSFKTFSSCSEILDQGGC